MTATRKPSSRLSQRVQERVYDEMIRQTRQMHNFNLLALATPLFVALIGCYFVQNGQAAGAYIATVGTLATTVCIPLSKASSQDSSRRWARLIKEAKELSKQE